MQIEEAVKRELVERVLSDADRVSYDTLQSAAIALIRDQFDAMVFDIADDTAPALRETMKRRLELLYRAEYDEEFRASERARVRADKQAFFDDYIFQWNVKEKRVLPFVLFERQREILEWIDDKYRRQTPGLLKKSREFGLSCLSMGFVQHSFIFERHFYGGVASRAQKYLYKRDNWKAILNKFIFSLEHLPWWLRGSFRKEKHVTKNQIINPDNSNIVDGEAGDDIGQGGRASIFIVDEYSLHHDQQNVEQSLAGTADCVIYIYTSKGPTTYVRSRLEKENVYPILVTPWYFDPRKVDGPEHVGDAEHWSQWAAEKERQIGAVPFAQEFGCDDEIPDASGIIRPAWVTASEEMAPVRPWGMPVAGLDLADGGEDKHVLAVRHGPVLTLNKWSSLEVEEVAPPVVDELVARNVDVCFYDNQGRGSAFGKAATEYAKKVGAGHIQFVGVAAKAKPTAGRYLRDSSQSCRERFANRATELWWAMSLALRGCYERVQQGADFELAPDEFFRVPNDPELKAQLVTRKFERTARGIALEDKRRMSKSPDEADAVSLTFSVRPRKDSTADAIAPNTAAPTIW